MARLSNGIGTQQVTEQGVWIELHCLGAGGFGRVTLFENKITHEKLAIKKCRLELNRRNQERWEQEIDIMKNLNHPNVVKGLAVPEPLDVEGATELPLLAMEYCDGGNLRQVLNAAVNCCGLKESNVLRITEDIASGIQFLHSHRIIHRDLKPENIVISHSTGQPIYKLIDLGYAKQLGQSSLMQTVVGTMQYMAPELLSNQEYKKTVDYWSFGTVLFECITGMRPFFPELSLVQWHQETSKKADDDIWAYYDAEGVVRFSKVLPTPHFLCRTIENRFVPLLRLLLLWDPCKRGGTTDAHNNRECFTLLADIINSMIVNIFCITTGTIHSFEVSRDDSLKALQEKLQSETGLVVGQQEFVLQSGDVVYPSDPAAKCWKDTKCDDWMVFLFHTDELQKWPLLQPKPLPQNVQEFIKEPETCLSYQHLKKIYAYTIHYCQDVTRKCKLLVQGQMALISNLVKLDSIMTYLKQQAKMQFHRLEAKVDMFNISLQQDIEHYSDFVLQFQGNEEMLRNWKKSQKEIEALLEKANFLELEQKTLLLQSRKTELQKTQELLPREKTALHLDKIVDEAVKLYDNLRYPTDKDKSKLENCIKACQVVVRCRGEAEKLHKEINVNLRKVLACRRDSLLLIPELQSHCDVIIEQQKHVEEFQKQRQKDIWVLASTKEKTAITSSISSSLSSASIVVVDDNTRSMERMSEMLGTLKTTDEETSRDILKMDWSFLEDSETDRSEEEKE